MDARPVLRKAARAEYAVLRAPLALLNHRLGKRLSDDSFVRQALQFSLDRMDGIAGRLLKRGTVEPAEAPAAGGMNTAVDTAENTDTAEPTDLDAADLDAIGVDGADIDTGGVDTADLEVADLDGTELDVADLDVADLDVADLDVADLDVADLDIADLEVADLDIADLDVPIGATEPAAGDVSEPAAADVDSADLQVTGAADAGSAASDAPVVLEQLPTADYEAAEETILEKEEAVPVGELADASEADLEALAALRAKHLLEEREQQRRLEQERDR